MCERKVTNRKKDVPKSFLQLKFLQVVYIVARLYVQEVSGQKDPTKRTQPKGPNQMDPTKWTQPNGPKSIKTTVMSTHFVLYCIH